MKRTKLHQGFQYRCFYSRELQEAVHTHWSTGKTLCQAVDSDNALDSSMHVMEKVPKLHLNCIIFDTKEFKALSTTEIEAQ